MPSLPFPYGGAAAEGPVGGWGSWPAGAPDWNHINPLRMTLCGSEVPQDRWRGRTAGSGMWTLTRDNLLSWSLDDPAITYG